MSNASVFFLGFSGTEINLNIFFQKHENLEENIFFIPINITRDTYIPDKWSRRKWIKNRYYFMMFLL